MAVINLKVLFNDLKSIQKFELEIDTPGCDCCSPTLKQIPNNECGDWIKVEDLKAILEQYNDDVSLI